MRTTRIYLPFAEAASSSIISLSSEQAHYLHGVLRLKPGKMLHVFDGIGHCYQANIEALTKRQGELRIVQLLESPRPQNMHLHLGQCLSRGERMDFVMQKATECGVSEITPLISEHCAVKLKTSALEKKYQHWQRIIISACEQCGQNTLPKLNPPQPLTAWARDQPSDSLSIILHTQTEDTSVFKQPAPQNIRCLVGPEGGFSPEEITLSQHCSFTPLSLGPRILRTETAAIAALSLCQYHWGDWNNP